MYDTLYYWNVDVYLKEGKKVYCVDMARAFVFEVNKMTVNEWYTFLNSLKNDNDSNYIFYVEREA